MSVPKNLGEFDALVKIIAKLRGQGGCPWDRIQTHASLREHLLEETYEVLEALDTGDKDKLCEELGDLLLQIVLHVRIAEEAGEFGLSEVLSGINIKLVHRHPHVFGSKAATNADEVLVNWEALKKQERDKEASMLDGIPKQMPALTYSQSMQKRVARVGFDWDNDEGVIDKLVEEVDELHRASNHEERVAEFGDIIFTLANIARRQGIDLESALRQTNERFYIRFSFMERLCYKRGLELAKLPLSEKNALWEEAKNELAEPDNGRGERT